MATIAQTRQLLKHQFADASAAPARLDGDPDGRQLLEMLCQEQPRRGRQRVWTPLATLWTFMAQVLHTDCSCRQAVAMVLSQWAVAGKRSLPSADPSAYCQARRRLPLTCLRQAVRRIAEPLRQQVSQTLTWCGRRVWLVDGTSCSMPDTPALRKAFGQPGGQQSGCGFPVATVVGLFCWASGAVLEAVVGPYAMSELRLWRQLWPHLSAGEIVLGDRFYCSFYDIVGVRHRGADAVFRLHQRRRHDLRQGRRLGKHDRLVSWARPTWQARPRG